MHYELIKRHFTNKLNIFLRIRLSVYLHWAEKFNVPCRPRIPQISLLSVENKQEHLSIPSRSFFYRPRT